MSEIRVPTLQEIIDDPDTDMSTEVAAFESGYRAALRDVKSLLVEVSGFTNSLRVKWLIAEIDAANEGSERKAREE